MQKILCHILLCVMFLDTWAYLSHGGAGICVRVQKTSPGPEPGDVCKAGIYSMHSMVQACSRVAVPYGWKLPSGMPLMTPARCSVCTAT